MHHLLTKRYLNQIKIKESLIIHPRIFDDVQVCYGSISCCIFYVNHLDLTQMHLICQNNFDIKR